MAVHSSFRELLIATAGCVGTVGLATHPVAAEIIYETRALTGEPAPGTEPGVVFSSFESPAINGMGDIAFHAILAGPGVDGNNREGAWADSGESLGLVARTGAAAPGTDAGVVFQSLSGIFTNDAGESVIRAAISGPGVLQTVNERGIWSGPTNSLSIVARTGDATPGIGPDVRFSSLFEVLFNDAGDAAFSGRFAGANEDGPIRQGVWSESGGSLRLIARSGEAAPGTGPGVVFESLINRLLFNDWGNAVFLGSLTGPGVDRMNDSGLWMHVNESNELIARAGDSAPGTGPGVVFSEISAPTALNDAGDIVFLGSLAGPGVDGTNFFGVWSVSGESQRLVVRRGDPAPGLGPDVVFDAFDTVLMDGSGDIVFLGTLKGSGLFESGQAVWIETDNDLELVVMAGDPAPGAGPGAVFRAFEGTFALGASGNIAVQGHLLDAQGRPAGSGIWATDADGVLHPIAISGTLFDVNDDPLIDDLRIVSGISFITNSSGEDGQRGSLNDAGELAFRLSFTDGTEGVFVAQIPEPSSSTFLLFGGASVYTRRRGGWRRT